MSMLIVLPDEGQFRSVEETLSLEMVQEIAGNLT